MLMHRFFNQNFRNQFRHRKLRIVTKEVVLPCTSLSVSVTSSSDTAVENLDRGAQVKLVL